jgi:hypothetical protein
MRANLTLLFAAACLAPGCGPSAAEQATNSPEFRQRRLEIQQQREAEEERLKKELQDVQTSTEAALRVAERLLQATESAKSEPANPTPLIAPAEPGPATKSIAVPSAAGLKNSAGWTQLRAGLSTAAVTALLGPPTATTEDRALLYWHYGAGSGSGRIAFLHSGQLVAWQPPVQ